MSRSGAAEELRAKDVMTREVLVAHPGWPIEQLNEFLVEKGISGAPVVNDDHELVGVVSLTDIARASALRDTDLSGETRHEYYGRLLDEPWPSDEIVFVANESGQVKVREIMTPVVLEVSEETPLSEIADSMIAYRVHRLFVTDGRKLRGIVAALDMLKVLASK